MSLPLDGLRVLDLTRALSGPFCTMILGDLGADVVKTEAISGGDMCRGWGPFQKGIGVYFLSINRNKRSLAIDFRTQQGLDVLGRMARGVDILVENFKPGTVDKMGLDYDTLKNDNPGLIYASIAGFGQDGPYGNWPGYDQIAQGMSGMMSISGQPDGPPTRLGIPLADLVAGIWTSLGITAALTQRHNTNRGQRVDTSLLAGVVGLLCVQGQRYLSLGEIPGRIGNEHPVIYPYGAFEAADGLINIAAGTEAQWAKLCEVLGLKALIDDPEFSDNTQRSQNRTKLTKHMNASLRRRSALEWTNLLMEAGVPAGPVYDLEQVFNDPHVVHAEFVETVEHPTIGSLKQLSNPLRLGEMGHKTVRRPPPQLGEHGNEVLQSFGFSKPEIDELERSGVILNPGDQA